MLQDFWLPAEQVAAVINRSIVAQNSVTCYKLLAQRYRTLDFEGHVPGPPPFT